MYFSEFKNCLNFRLKTSWLGSSLRQEVSANIIETLSYSLIHICLNKTLKKRNIRRQIRESASLLAVNHHNYHHLFAKNTYNTQRA